MSYSQQNYNARNKGAVAGKDYDVRNPTLQGLLPGRDLSKGREGLFGFDRLTYDSFQKGTTIQQKVADRLNSGGTYAASGAMWGNPGPGVRVTDDRGRSATVSQAAADSFNAKQQQARDAQTQNTLQQQQVDFNKNLTDALAAQEERFMSLLNDLKPAAAVPAPMSIQGNAAGVKRKKSKAESSGSSSKGSSQFNRSMYINPVTPLNNLNL